MPALWRQGCLPLCRQRAPDQPTDRRARVPGKTGPRGILQLFRCYREEEQRHALAPLQTCSEVITKVVIREAESCGMPKDECSFAGAWRGTGPLPSQSLFVSSYFFDRAIDSELVTGGARLAAAARRAKLTARFPRPLPARALWIQQMPRPSVLTLRPRRTRSGRRPSAPRRVEPPHTARVGPRAFQLRLSGWCRLQGERTVEGVKKAFNRLEDPNAPFFCMDLTFQVRRGWRTVPRAAGSCNSLSTLPRSTSC